MIVDCTGVVRDPLASSNPVIQNLFERGLARPDVLNIGIDVAENCAIIIASSVASERLFAIGPLTRSAFWEIVAVPDIRNQCADLATRILTLGEDNAPSTAKAASKTMVTIQPPMQSALHAPAAPAESPLPRSAASRPRTAETAT